eukprot:GHVP01053002.1.p1 GENE.GHVP01053002.1~~GHVP01053002.1.p1  ORF type:complete len:386 (+),score=76.72 GHVP01053002.1:171-1328(+)
MGEIRLNAGTEFRFEVAENKIQISVEEGFAEVFGTELAFKKTYTFRRGCYSIFTPFGCSFKIEGEPLLHYMSNKETNIDLLEYSIQLGESVVLVLGNGRNATSRILSNYLTRSKRGVVYADIDPNSLGLLFAGTVNIRRTEYPLKATCAIENDGILSWFSGMYTGEESAKQYRRTISSVAKKGVEIKKKDDIMIINGLRNSLPHINDIIKEFGVTDILIVGDERLNAFLSKTIPDYIKLKTIPLSDGYAQRDNSQKDEIQTDRIHEYFYGYDNRALPFLKNLGKDTVVIKKVVESVLAPLSALPIGKERRIEDDLTVADVAIEDSLYSILGVSNADDEHGQVDGSVFGYVLLSNLKEETINLLLPDKELPSKVLISRGIKWIERK